MHGVSPSPPTAAEGDVPDHPVRKSTGERGEEGGRRGDEEERIEVMGGERRWGVEKRVVKREVEKRVVEGERGWEEGVEKRSGSVHSQAKEIPLTPSFKLVGGKEIPLTPSLVGGTTADERLPDLCTVCGFSSGLGLHFSQGAA